MYGSGVVLSAMFGSLRRSWTQFARYGITLRHSEQLLCSHSKKKFRLVTVHLNDLSHVRNLRWIIYIVMLHRLQEMLF